MLGPAVRRVDGGLFVPHVDQAGDRRFSGCGPKRHVVGARKTEHAGGPGGAERAQYGHRHRRIGTWPLRHDLAGETVTVCDHV